MLRRTVLFLGVLAVLALAAGPALAVQYTITELGTLGGATPTTEVNGINNLGQVVGYSYNSDDLKQAFIWENGVMTAIDNFGLVSEGIAINNNGTVVGEAFVNEGPVGTTVAFQWTSGGGAVRLFENLGDPASYPMAINNNGVVVGEAQFDGSNNQAFCFNGTSLVNLGDLMGCNYMSSEATGVNSGGYIVGWGFSMTTYSNVPFLYNSSAGTITNLNDVVADVGIVYGINDDGWVIGKTNAGAGILSDGTTTHSIAAFDLTALNNHCQVVGYTPGISYPGFEFPGSSWIYEDGTATDLFTVLENPGQWTELTRALDINDAGQIVGYGKYNGETRAYLLTPVPEPSTVALAALGLVGLLCYAWRKRK